MNGAVNLQEEPIAELGTPEDLEQRLRWIPLGDTVRGILFNSLLEAVRQEVDEEAFQRCITAAEAPHFLAFFNYPVRSLLKLTYTAAWALSEKYGGFEKAMHQLGNRAVPDFLESPIGWMLRAVTGVDARRILNWVPVVFPTVYNHGSFKLTWLDDKQGRGVMSGALFCPPFTEASIGQLLTPFHLPELSIRARRVGLLDTEVLVSWK